jgi:hypothetical protein
MAVADFTAALQSTVYKEWLSTLDKNIITANAAAIRQSQLSSEKTSFYITQKQIETMFKTITGEDIDPLQAQLAIGTLLGVGASPDTLAGTSIKINGQPGVFFKNINFDTISTKLNEIFDEMPKIEDAYQKAESEYYNRELAALQKDKKYISAKIADRRKLEQKIRDKAAERATLGFYFNKGHVISIATNALKQFREQLAKIDFKTQEQRKVLLEVLDAYINKLESDDLASANLPAEVYQELSAKVDIKSSSRYLIEMQDALKNLGSGRSSIAIVEEVRGIFNLSENNFASIIANSPALGATLVSTPGSPAVIELIAQDLADTMAGQKLSKKIYKQPKVVIGKKVVKISKPKSNKQKIQKLKNLKSKIKAVRSNSKKLVEKLIQESDLLPDLNSLQNIINTLLAQQIRQNMGTGTSRDVLNYQTGRFAQSARVERITQGRAGMISAYYTYMKYPYATFSEGGRQEFPRSRDPKLLISKSIREIMQQQMITRMRAVLI